MSLESTHPAYDIHVSDWLTMRDTYKGERFVKGKTTTYLPATKGMLLDGMGYSSGKVSLGQEAYDAYLIRSVFPDYIKDAIETYIGLLHKKPPTIELPSIMEPLRENATLQAEPLELLLRRINEEQLVTGRCGILLDLPVVPDQSNPLPYIALYAAESIRNWDDGEINEGNLKLNFVILDESGYKRNENFEWIKIKKYRVLHLDIPIVDADASVATDNSSVYTQGVFVDTSQYNSANDKVPLLRGIPINEIPFIFINTKDIVTVPDEPPLMGLARLSLAIYRGEADYRQSLFMQGQDTLVVVGDRKKAMEDIVNNEPVRTGSGSMIELEIGGSAEYVGVSGKGLPEQRAALEADRKRAETRSGQLIDASSGNKESGEALKARIGAQTATLNQIANTGAAALENLLRIAATWMGADPDEVVVTPNLEFADISMTGEDLVKLMTARTMGAPISKQSIHELMERKGLTVLDYETERGMVDQENREDPLMGTGEGGDE